MAATGTIVALLTVGIILLATGLHLLVLNYVIGSLVLLAWLFELVAIVLGVIGIFEGRPHRLRAASAVVVSLVIFAAMFVFLLLGSRMRHGGLR